jgi:ankyrin repeat protein
MAVKRAARGVVVLLLTAASIGGSVTAVEPAELAEIIDAARKSDLAAVRALLARRADPNSAEPDGTTTLHRAVHNDNGDMVDLLIRAGARVTTANRYGVSPLHVACLNGSARVVESLLKAGAPVATASPAGETVLMTCARTGNVAAIKALVDGGADVNAKESWHGQTALMWASAEGHTEAVRFLIGRGADVGARSNEEGLAPGSAAPRVAGGRVTGGFTPLLYAVREGDLATSRVLLDAGASAKEASADGTSALVLAVLNAHYEMAALLLDRGADPNVPDAKHGSALHALSWVRRQAPGIGMGSSPMFPRIPTGDIDGLALGKKLLDMGASPNARFKVEDPTYSRGASGNTFYYVTNPPDFALSVSTLNWDGATPFWLAAKNADAPYMRLLASHGADPLATNRVNVTPLMAASGSGFMQGEHPGTEAEALEAAKLAIELGNDIQAVAKFNDDEERADYRFSEMTALHGAAQRGANSIVTLLVERGARLDAKTREGWTPFNIADGIQIGGTFKNSPDTAALLRTLMTERGLKVEEIHLDTFTAAGKAGC